RGASLQNFADFGVHFPNGDETAPTLPLTTNRRSGPAILTVANRIRQQLHADPDPLVAVEGSPNGEVITAWLGTAAEEAAWIASELERQHESGVPWRACAVLFRKNKDMQMVHDALSQRDIPFEVANLGGLLSVPEVADLVAWLGVLARAEDTVALARLLTGSRFRLGLADLARLSDWVRTRRDEIDDDIEGLPDYTLLEALDHLDEIGDLRPAARAALDQFHAEHRRFLTAAQGLSLVELCRTILDGTGAWQDVEAMTDAAGLSARLNLFRFLDLAESWSPLEGRPSLPAFTRYLDLMRDNPREELDTARLSDADAVTLITVHRAKGLEWDVVFLPATYRGNFPSQYRGGDPYTSAEILPFEYRLDRDTLPPIDEDTDEAERRDLLRRRHLDAEWRLAYVAVTRARRRLVVSGAWWYGHPMPLRSPTQPSELFELVRESSHHTHDVPEPPPRPSRSAYRAEGPPPDPSFDGGWAAALRQALTDPDSPRRHAENGLLESYDAAVLANQERLFALPDPPPAEKDPTVYTSATGLVTYATCPLRYRWSFVDPLPRRSADAARRGTEVHRRIELHNLGVVPLDELHEASYDLAPEGDAAGTGDPFAVFEQSRYAGERPLLTEAAFDLQRPHGRIRGRIDAVYGTPDHWEVVDFKSGRDRDDGPNLVQLQTYALAATDTRLGPPPPEDMTVSFVYLGGPEPATRHHPVTEEWLVRATETVDGLLDGIKEERWEATPSDACRHCDFLRFCEVGRRHLDAV
ncbi:MAG TPA: ATP-dependent DNA helicase, partial [Acidimicrobiia bacterium]|nr:ATP-dependent DNA helicase [Acidimicrobiia bacterium]